MYGFTRTRHTGRLNSIATRGAQVCKDALTFDFLPGLHFGWLWLCNRIGRLIFLLWFSLSSQQGRLSNSSDWFLMSKEKEKYCCFSLPSSLLPKISFLFLRFEEEELQEKCRSFDFPLFLHCKLIERQIIYSNRDAGSAREYSGLHTSHGALSLHRLVVFITPTADFGKHINSSSVVATRNNLTVPCSILSLYSRSVCLCCNKLVARQLSRLGHPALSSSLRLCCFWVLASNQRVGDAKGNRAGDKC